MEWTEHSVARLRAAEKWSRSGTRTDSRKERPESVRMARGILYGLLLVTLFWLTLTVVLMALL